MAENTDSRIDVLSKLSAFMNQVEAQKDKAISIADADILSDAAAGNCSVDSVRVVKSSVVVIVNRLGAVWHRRKMPSEGTLGECVNQRIRASDLSGISGDTSFGIVEGIAKSKIGSGECGIGCIEVVEQMLDGAVGTGIGERMNTDCQLPFGSVGNDVCVGSKQVAQ